MKKQKSNDPIQLILLSREDNFDNIQDAFCNSFRLPKSEIKNVTTFSNQNCTIELLILLPSMEEEVQEFIRKQKNMIYGYFAQVASDMEDIKINLCHHIRQSKAFVSLMIREKHPKVDLQREADNIIHFMLEVMKEMDGILLTDEGTVAREKEGRIILSGDGSSDLDSYFPFILEEQPVFLEDCTARQKIRRTENMRYLFDKGIYVCELPVNDDDEEITLRDKTEVVRRMLGLLVVSLYSEAMLNPEELMSVEEARTFVQGVMEGFAVEQAEDILTPEELAYLQDDSPAEKTQIDYSWHYEHLYMLEWVLGLTEWTEPVDICDVGLMVRNLKPFASIEELCAKTTMRSKKEILDKADLVYRMDWAAVDARIHRMTGPAHLEHGVVQARHKTLNWMIQFENADWDDVDVPT